MARRYGSLEGKDKRKQYELLFYAIAILLSVTLVAAVFGEEAGQELMNTYRSCAQYYFGEQDKLGDGEMEVTLIDIGQGDCTLVRVNGGTILIDAGENGRGDDVVDYLRSRGINQLDWVVCTHPHSDHMGGMDTVIKKMNIGKMMMPEIPTVMLSYDKFYLDVLSAAEAKSLEIVRAQAGMAFELGEAKITVLSPSPNDGYGDLNDWSLALRISCGEIDFLACGDMTAESEFMLLEGGVLIEAEIFKASHHGSQYSNFEEFLDAVKPQVVLISCGENNDYGHPHESVLKRLRDRNIDYYRTDLHGNITILCSDGEMTVTKEK